MKKLTRSMLIKDLKKHTKEFQKKNTNSKHIITRDYYRKHSEHNSSYTDFWGSFEDFKNDAFGKSEIESFDKKKKIVILEEENKQLKKDNEKLLKEIIDNDTLLNLYKENLDKEHRYPIFTKKVKGKTKDSKAILNLSDFHLGEVVAPEYVNYTNEFNKEICIQRLDSIFSTFVYYCKEIKIKEVHLLFNGDLLGGGIHRELERNSDLNEVESIFYLQKYIIKKLSELTKNFDKIHVDFVVGNHGRILQGRPYFKEKTTMNYEYILARQIEMYFNTLRNNEKIIVNVAESPFVVKSINGTKFLVTHGDVLTGAGSGGFAGIPFYSICMSAAKLFGMLKQINITENTQFDHIVCGHLHTSTKIPLFNGGFCFVGGCVIGTNEFSLFKMKSVAKREQLMLVIDKEGNIDGEINIRF